MKRFINYFYGIEINNIIKKNEMYVFTYKQKKYVLKKCQNTNIDKYYDMLKCQLDKYKLFFDIIRNRQGGIITNIEGDNYVLLGQSNIPNRHLELSDIRIDMFVDIENLDYIYYQPWSRLWEQKIDYFEDYFNNKNDKLENIYWIYQYIIGMSELALIYLKEAEKSIASKKSDSFTVQHKRIGETSMLFDYYDPTNIIIDHSCRDVSEYIKSLNINKISLDTLDTFLSKQNISEYWIKMFYSRIIFPSNIFDEFEQLLLQNIKVNYKILEEKMINHIKIVNYIGIYLKNKYGITIIKLK